MINEIDVDDSGTVDFEGLLKLNNMKKINVTRNSYKLSHKPHYLKLPRKWTHMFYCENGIPTVGFILNFSFITIRVKSGFLGFYPSYSNPGPPNLFFVMALLKSIL